jgi:hypothetical protein
VRTVEYGPPTPSTLNARTRQSGPAGSVLVASCDGVEVAAHTSGALNPASSSTSIVYQAAATTALPSNVNGWPAVAPSAGLSGAGAPGTGGGGGGGVDWMVIVRTADQGPGVPAELTPRTRQNHLPSGSALAVNREALVVTLRISGAPNCGISSTWIV